MEESKEIDVKGSDEFLTALYLFDETELQHCRQENLDQKQVSALVYIDNYDEALDSIEDVKRSLLIALVDRKVNQYFSKMDALVRKIEKTSILWYLSINIYRSLWTTGSVYLKMSRRSKWAMRWRSR